MQLRDSGDLDRIALADFGVNEGRRHFRTADTVILQHRSWLESSAADPLIKETAENIIAESQGDDDTQELDYVEAPRTALVLRDIRLIDS